MFLLNFLSSDHVESILGIEPPPAKKKSYDKNEADRQYDKTRRQRKVVPSWKSEFSWLITDETAVYCKVCRAIYGPFSNSKISDKNRKYGTGPFVKGCFNLRHDTLTCHQASHGHVQAQAIYDAKHAPPSKMLPADMMLDQLNDKNMRRLDKLFRNAHAIVKHSRPVTDYIWMCEVDDKKDVSDVDFRMSFILEIKCY